MIDSTGLRLQVATDALNAFGEIYMKQTLASGVIPQITAIFGNCGGGLAIIPTLTDFTFMEAKNAKLFVNAPNALDGNTVAKCDSASADFHATESGIVDVVAEEAELLSNKLENSAMLRNACQFSLLSRPQLEFIFCFPMNMKPHRVQEPILSLKTQRKYIYCRCRIKCQL